MKIVKCIVVVVFKLGMSTKLDKAKTMLDFINERKDYIINHNELRSNLA